MQKDLLTLLKDGQLYAKSWPLKRELAPLFVEFRVIKATQLAIKVLPMLAVLSLMMQISALGLQYIPQAIACSLLILSLPAQGLLWLGKRANTILPPSMVLWYQEIHQKMLDEGCQLPRVVSNPCYQELADLLKQAFDKMDSAFTKELF